MTFDNINILAVRDGKLVEYWAVADMPGLMPQLAVVPAPC